MIYNDFIGAETELTGTIDTECTMEGTVDLELELSGEVSFSGSVPEYDGAYEIVPKISDQSLDTSGKKLTKDLVILAIPVQETTNSANGKTIHIG